MGRIGIGVIVAARILSLGRRDQEGTLRLLRRWHSYS